MAAGEILLREVLAGWDDKAMTDTMVYCDPRTEALKKRVRAVFCNQGLQEAAMLMAGVSEYAIQYIEQAPILVLAATFGEMPRTRRERAQIAQWFGTAIHKHPRLSHVMRHYNLPSALRAIEGTTLAFCYYDAIVRLSKMKNSTLAQLIPPRKERQRTWLASLAKWCAGMASRQKAKSHHFAWAASALCRLNTAESEMALDLLDFIHSSGRPFNEVWTLQQAKAAESKWHAELGKRHDASKFFEQFNIGFSDRIDYAPFPASERVAGYDFQALDTGERIYTEGAAMHHCVSTYFGRVLHGLSRLFSIQKDGHRVATVEYAVQGSRYRTVQIKGPCNRAVTAAVKTAADAFVAAMPPQNV